MTERDLAWWADHLASLGDGATLPQVLRAVAEQHPAVRLSGRQYCEKCRTEVADHPLASVAFYASDLWPCATVRAVLDALGPLAPPEPERRVPTAPSVQPPEVPL